MDAVVVLSAVVFGWAFALAAHGPSVTTYLLCVVATAALALVSAERVRQIEEREDSR